MNMKTISMQITSVWFAHPEYIASSLKLFFLFFYSQKPKTSPLISMLLLECCDCAIT